VSAEAGAERAALASAVLELRRELLRVLNAEMGELFDDLVELDVNARRLAELAEAYRTYIEERILGVRSTTDGILPQLAGTRRELQWLLAPSPWLSALRNVGSEIPKHFGATAWRLLLLVAVLFLQRTARRELDECADLVSDYRADRFRHTMRALAASFVLALPLPLVLWNASWLLALHPAQPDVALAAATGIGSCAAWFMGIEFVRQLFRSNGLARKHFRWPESTVAIVRRNLRWLDALILPSIFLVATMQRVPRSLKSDSLERIALWIGLIALASFCRRVLRPAGPVLSPYLNKAAGGWIDRLRLVWYPLSFLMPVVLVGLSVAGYQYTALVVSRRWLGTIGFVFGLLIINALLMRWLFVAKRSVMLDQAAARREARESEEKVSGEAADLGLGEEDGFNFSAMGEKTRKLFASLTMIAAMLGMWSIWEDVLPAMRQLDRIQVWPSWRLVELEDDWAGGRLEASTGVEAGAADSSSSAGSGTSAISTSLIPGMGATRGGAGAGDAAPLDLGRHVIRLSDLLWALVTLLITVIAARDIPSLIEILLVQFFSVDAGARYAVGTIARYFVTLVGATLFLQAFHIGWDSVQWLAAALTFGLAFGLQEIFANFVSGVILLIERPIRIGDLVTVGDLDGYVSKIRFRATTILDWDRREMIVPNKDFITGRLINWTLTDPITRVTVPVGIAYGSDTRLARKLLLEAAEECEFALKDPRPRAIFLGFGDSTLDFQLRVFIPTRDVYPDLMHELHTLVDDKFRENGVEIAFPQRDLHIRSGLEGLGERDE
jgi:potassium efflux system protein